MTSAVCTGDLVPVPYTNLLACLTVLWCMANFYFALIILVYWLTETSAGELVDSTGLLHWCDMHLYITHVCVKCYLTFLRWIQAECCVGQISSAFGDKLQGRTRQLGFRNGKKKTVVQTGQNMRAGIVWKNIYIKFQVVWISLSFFDFLQAPPIQAIHQGKEVGSRTSPRPDPST